MLLSIGSVHAEATSSDATTERCIPLQSIKQTKIVDDQTVIFYVGSKRYKNRLPHPCSGLAGADRFTYRTTESKLCNVDVITVLNQLGTDYMPGASCGLGMFEPIDQQQLDQLTKKPHKNP
jgi:hypothetical protein